MLAAYLFPDLWKQGMTETDPNGLDAHTPGAKLDQGKVDFELTERGFANALHAVAQVATYGAAKYTKDGWQEVPDAVRRYYSAGGRHRNKHNLGQLFDDDSGYLHKAHEAWCILAQLELILRELNGS